MLELTDCALSRLSAKLQCVFLLFKTERSTDLRLGSVADFKQTNKKKDIMRVQNMQAVLRYLNHEFISRTTAVTISVFVTLIGQDPY